MNDKVSSEGYSLVVGEAKAKSPLTIEKQVLSEDGSSVESLSKVDPELLLKGECEDKDFHLQPRTNYTSENPHLFIYSFLTLHRSGREGKWKGERTSILTRRGTRITRRITSHTTRLDQNAVDVMIPVRTNLC